MYSHKNSIVFRKLERDDLEMLKDLKSDSWMSTHRVAFVNSQDQLRWFDSIPANALHFIAGRSDTLIVARKPVPGLEDCEKQVKDYQPVGLLSLTNIDNLNRSAQIGGSIFRDARGTEWSRKAWEAGTDFAFEMLNLHRIDGEVLENNPAALAMDISLGYKIEGKRRQAVYKSGLYLDSYIVGYLREEWEKSAIRRYDGCCNQNFKARVSSEKVLKRIGIELPPEIVLDSQVPTEVHFDGPKPEDIEKYRQAIS